VRQQLAEARALARALVEQVNRIEASLEPDQPTATVVAEPTAADFEKVARRRARRRR
jgi:ribosomal protein S9